MKIELNFLDIPADIQDAAVDIYIEDQSEADASSVRLGSSRIDRLKLSQSLPPLVLDLDPNLDQHVLNSDRELSVIVRVKSRTLTGEAIEFLNTITTPVPSDPTELVRVILSRIA